jgi:hypothetical protein
MTHVLPFLSAFACLAMMFGAGAIMWLGTKTPLRRIPVIGRRAQCRLDNGTHQANE